MHFVVIVKVYPSAIGASFAIITIKQLPESIEALYMSLSLGQQLVVYPDVAVLGSAYHYLLTLILEVEYFSRRRSPEDFEFESGLVRSGRLSHFFIVISSILQNVHYYMCFPNIHNHIIKQFLYNQWLKFTMVSSYFTNTPCPIPKSLMKYSDLSASNLIQKCLPLY